MAKGSGLFHNSSVKYKGDSRSSASQNTSVGSGSRPTRSRIPIQTSDDGLNEPRKGGTRPLK